MKKILLFIFAVQITYINGQVGVSTTAITPDPSSILEVRSNEKGVLIPRMTEGDRTSISNPSESLLLYQRDQTKGYYYNAGSPSSPNWQRLATDQEIQSRTKIDTLPYTISVSGSYYLCKTLMSTTTGITISTSDVTVDLNGYALMGGAGNSSPGINITSGDNITVVNGYINGWSQEGIKADLSSRCNFSDLSISQCQKDGIKSGIVSKVYNVSSTNNTNDGIDVGDNSIVQYCQTISNGQDGIKCTTGGQVRQCIANQNTGIGIRANGANIVAQCIANQNFSHGISVGNGASVSNCNSEGNFGSGYYMLSGSMLYDNNARNNSSYGFILNGSYNQLKGNKAHGNLSGYYTVFDKNMLENNIASNHSVNGFQISAIDCVIIKNTSFNNTTSNYTIASNNIVGTILTAATINTSSNPNANFSN